jgi:two-component system response regulator DesR
MVIRVLLVEETDLVRGALAALLAREEDIKVVAESAGSAHAVARAMSYRPDVAVIDIDGQEGWALAAARELASRLPECRTGLVAAASSRQAEAWIFQPCTGSSRPSGRRTSQSSSSWRVQDRGAGPRARANPPRRCSRTGTS